MEKLLCPRCNGEIELLEKNKAFDMSNGEAQNQWTYYDVYRCSVCHNEVRVRDGEIPFRWYKWIEG